jgi:hypothetical protein
VLIKPSVFRVDDIIPKFGDMVPHRARYCLAIAARIEARTSVKWVEIDNYYNERWHKDLDSGDVAFANLRLSTSTYGIFAFRIIEHPNDTVGAYRFYGIRSEMDFCKLDNWYSSE